MEDIRERERDPELADGETTRDQDSMGTENKKVDMSTIDCVTDEGSQSRKRENYISWEDYYMAVAVLSAKRSKDPHKQVGACIVDMDKKIVGCGYNGMPTGCHDDLMDWSKHDKLLYVCHAELNAIVNKNSADVKGCKLYVTLFPCNECTKLIIQSGIKKVIFQHYDDSKKAKAEYKASEFMLKMAGVKIKKFEPERKEIPIKLK